MSQMLLCSQLNDKRFVLFTQDSNTQNIFAVGFHKADEVKQIVDDERAWALIDGGAILRAVTIGEGQNVMGWAEGCDLNVQIPIGRPGFAFVWVKVPDEDWERGSHFRPPVH